MLNEEQIKQTLADNLKANEVAQEKPGLIRHPEVEPIGDITSELSEHNNLPLDALALRSEIIQLLDIPHGTQRLGETESRIQTIIEWATNNARGTDMADILEVIQSHITGMGWQVREDKLERLYKFVRLNNIRRTVTTQIGALRG